MNWETTEVDLIIMNSEGLYIDMLYGVDTNSLIKGCPMLFDHIDLKEVDYDYLDNQYKDYIKEYTRD